VSELVEFESFSEIEVLLRAAIELKFESAHGSDLLDGSSVYASALSNLRNGLISGIRSSASPGRAQSLEEWYRLSNHRHRWSIIARKAGTSPRWREFSREEKDQFVGVIAAPLSMDQESLEVIRLEADSLAE
jgi:hypothetical protein